MVCTEKLLATSWLALRAAVAVAPAFGRLRRLVELAYDVVGSSNLADTVPNKKGPENQVPFYLARPERFELPTLRFVA